MPTTPRRRWAERSRAALAASGLLLAAAGPAGPEAATEGFYRTYVHAHPSGVPSAALRRALAPFMTQALAAALERAGRADAKYTADTQNEVPPLVEGDPFSSLSEGPTGYRVEPCQLTSDSASCPVRLEYREPGAKEPVIWHDTALLLRQGGAWRVDDIAWQGFEFGNKGRLRQALDETGAYLDGPPAHPPSQEGD